MCISLAYRYGSVTKMRKEIYHDWIVFIEVEQFKPAIKM